MKKNIIIFGHKRHGKDTDCEYLEQVYGLRFISSSFYACQNFIYDEMKATHGYSSIEECFEDRDNHRAFWYDRICAFNTPDKTRMGRAIFAHHDVYCGIRDKKEFEALREGKLFDLAIWIDASDRLPPEDGNSMKLTQQDADIVVSNNGTKQELHRKLDNLYAMLGCLTGGPARL